MALRVVLAPKEDCPGYVLTYPNGGGKFSYIFFFCLSLFGYPKGRVCVIAWGLLLGGLDWDCEGRSLQCSISALRQAQGILKELQAQSRAECRGQPAWIPEQSRQGPERAGNRLGLRSPVQCSGPGYRNQAREKKG